MFFRIWLGALFTTALKVSCLSLDSFSSEVEKVYILFLIDISNSSNLSMLLRRLSLLPRALINCYVGADINMNIVKHRHKYCATKCSLWRSLVMNPPSMF